jgi:hypothetical protein
MKLPKGRVLGKFPGRPGVVFDALAQAPAGLNGYVRVVGPEATGQIGVILLERGEPVGCLVAGPKQSFGRAALGPLLDLAADEASQVRLIGFYEESLDEVRATSDNMKRVASVTRADFEAARRGGAAPRPGDFDRVDAKAAAQVVDAVKAPPAARGKGAASAGDAGFFKELLETGIRAARVESEAAGESLDPDMAAKLEDYLSKSNLQLDDALTTIASVMTPKQGQGPEERALPAAVKDEIKGAEDQLAKTAQRYEYLITKDMASAKALRDQEENLAKMETQLKDLKANVQGEGEKRLRELEERSARASGAEAKQILGKLKEEQEAIYARVEKLVQMENLFKQNLLTQRKRIEQKEQELQALAQQLKSDFLERKRLLDEEKESYLEDLRRQSKELKTREAVAIERERRASDLAARLETEIEQKIRDVEAKRKEFEARDRELRSRAEALTLRESEMASKSKTGESRAEVARQRGELAKEREEHAAKIAALSKREEELRSLEARLNERRTSLEAAERGPKSSGVKDDELKEMIVYLDRLLEALPPDKISEFASSEFYHLYIKLLERLGI